jgi:uncharacterized protein YdeI (BOF family)
MKKLLVLCVSALLTLPAFAAGTHGSSAAGTGTGTGIGTDAGTGAVGDDAALGTDSDVGAGEDVQAMEDDEFGTDTGAAAGVTDDADTAQDINP